MELIVRLTAGEIKRVLREGLKVIGVNVEGRVVDDFETVGDAEDLYEVTLCDALPIPVPPK